MENQITQPKKVRKLSKKQQGFVEDYIETGNGVKSALNNYDTNDYNTANQIAIENLQKPTIQNAIKSIADQIPDEDLIRVHKEGLEATEGLLHEPDYSVRHKYLESAYKLKGLYGAETPDDKPKSNNTYNFIFSAETQKDIKILEDKIKAQLLQKHVQES